MHGGSSCSGCRDRGLLTRRSLVISCEYVTCLFQILPFEIFSPKERWCVVTCVDLWWSAELVKFKRTTWFFSFTIWCLHLYSSTVAKAKIIPTHFRATCNMLGLTLCVYLTVQYQSIAIPPVFYRCVNTWFPAVCRVFTFVIASKQNSRLNKHRLPSLRCCNAIRSIQRSPLPFVCFCLLCFVDCKQTKSLTEP